MKIVKNLSCLFLTLIITNSVLAQNPGDTIKVQVLDYSISSRDVTAIFPTNPSLSFEKVIMRYAMRCKNGLVSPPISGQTNIGCGEWDYSCNTYITDSTKADSSAATIAKYAIYPDTNSSGIYSTTPTWQSSPIIQQKVILQSINSEDTTQIGSGNLADSTIFNPIGNGGKTYLLLKSSELVAGGLISGDIDGLSLTNTGGNGQLSHLRIKLKNTTLNNLEFIDSTDFRNLQESYYHDFTFLNGTNRIPFHSPFNWNGTSNILVEFSFKPGNGAQNLKIESHATSAVELIANSNDFVLDLAPNNYIQATGYKGISGNNARTIEAWIKTGANGKDIVSWGTNSSGQKFIFRLDGTNKLRVEVNGGSIIGTKVLNDNKWHHVAVTFNGTSMYNFKFYVDGVRDNPTAIANNTVNTGQSRDVEISKSFHNRYWDGQVDNVRIWSTDLADSTIRKWRYSKLNSFHPNYSSLELEYNIDSKSSIIADGSPNGRNGIYMAQNSFQTFYADDHFKEFENFQIRPNLQLFQGNYNLTVSNDTIQDTLFFDPFIVSENTIFPKPGTVFTDSIGVVTTNYWPQNNISYDLNGNVVSTTPSSNTLQITNSTLNYIRRVPQKFELMSFVTPYGINLDLGIDGKAWFFDVSDFLPILNGPRRITLERGGQNQEEMDIQFYFIVGTPPRDVKKIDQIWQVAQTAYTSILNNTAYAPITLNLDTSAKQFKVRSAITGHGQQGEFIPRNHFININGGPVEFNRSVWKECAENPVYPQGGTWIYDRAGWCPGMATDVAEYDITALIGTADTVNIDYGVTTASGDSRYIVNNQLVSYGNPNFSLDGRIIEVISPTSDIEFGRNNPVCDGAEITIQNSGSTIITSMIIEYGVNSGAKATYTWTGSLNFLDKANVSLPTPSGFWSTLTNGKNDFTAKILMVNGMTDQYSFNNEIDRQFDASEIVPSNFILELTTNAAGSETSYNVKNAAGVILLQRSSLGNNTTYRDTFNLTTGCYSVTFFDANDDGLSFFGNSAGNGAMRIRNAGGSVVKIFEPNFGDNYSYNFTIPSPVSINEIDLSSAISLYPNPANSKLTLETTGLNNCDWSIFDGIGRLIESGVTAKDHHSKTIIDVSNLSEGVYYLQLNNNGKTSHKKFIVAE